jgi:hypothetical protein
VVDLADLPEDLLGLRLLRCHAPGIRVRSGGNAERAYRENECLRLSSPAGGHQLSRSGSTGAVPEGAGPHKFGTLAASSDVCNRFPSRKLTLSGKWPDRTKSRISAVFRPKHRKNIALCDSGHMRIRLVMSGPCVVDG